MEGVGVSDNSGIEWTDATLNVVTGCESISSGCDLCYARTFAERWRGTPGHYFENGFDVILRPDRLDLPLRWRKPRNIFVNSMSDLFHKDVPDEYVAQVFAVMAATPHHTYQILTKRHGRMRSLLSRGTLGAEGFPDMVEEAMVEFTHASLDEWPLNNVHLGVSAEDQAAADLRVPALLETPAAVRWVSAEPLLGPVDIAEWLPRKEVDDGLTVPTISWLVCGGESGRGARPMDEQWARDLVAQCQAAGIPAFVKQMGSAWAKSHGLRDKGGDPETWAGDLRVRQMPAGAR
jgi:protein gp37